MRTLLFTVTLGALVACGGNKGQAAQPGSAEAPGTTAEDQEAAGEDMVREGLTFQVEPVNDDAGQVQAVRIVATQPNGQRAEYHGYVGQDAVSDSRIAPENYWGVVEETDIDFDGTPDLTVAVGTFAEKSGAPQTIRVLAWRWDAEQHGFVRVENFPWNPALDEDNHRILGRKALYDGSQDYVPYYWHDGQLTPDYDQQWNSAEQYNDPFPLPAECLYGGEAPFSENDIAEMQRLFRANMLEDGIGELTRYALVSIDGDQQMEVWAREENDNDGGALFILNDHGVQLVCVESSRLKFHFYLNDRNTGYVRIEGPMGGPTHYTKVVSVKNSHIVETLELTQTYDDVVATLNGKTITKHQAMAWFGTMPQEEYQPSVHWRKFNE